MFRNLINLVLVYFLISIGFTGCSDESDKEPEFNDPLKHLPDKGTMNFESPAIGQRNRFVFFKATYSPTSGDVDFTYHPDTLVIAITGKSSETWIVTEFLTKGSNSRLHPANSTWGSTGDSVFVSNLVIDDDSIQFSRPGNSWVSFTILKGQKFPLTLVSDDFPENVGGLPHFTGYLTSLRWMEYVKNYERLGKTFDRLNIYFDYRDVATDGSGLTILYGPTYGLVRMAWVNPWTPDVAAGWDLILQ